MNIAFTQIYNESATNFNLSSELLGLCRKHLDALNKQIVFFENKFKTDSFELVFIISATRKSDELKVMGPTNLYKSKETEFVLYLPYPKEEFVSYNEAVTYVLDYIAQGIVFVLNKYETDSSGVEEALKRVLAEAISKPDEYKTKTKFYPGYTEKTVWCNCI